MLINADFTRRASVAGDQYEWVASPQSGVERVMLDRVGAEKARATSIVRYAYGSSFPHHSHPGGEEIFVLSGVFSADAEHYPAGWYLRNPPDSGHQPFSEEGAVIFVKLRQMQSHEQPAVRIDTRDPLAWRCEGGRAICCLYADEYEQVCLQRIDPHQVLLSEPAAGAELLILAGSLLLEQQVYEQGSWLRLPAGDCCKLSAGAQGVTVYLKTGHLGQQVQLPAAIADSGH